MAGNIKVKSDSQQFQSDMKNMAESIKLTTSEFTVIKTKADLFGNAQDKLKANISELTSKLSGQNIIFDMQKQNIANVTNEIEKYKSRNTELISEIDKKSSAIKEELKLNGENTKEYKQLTTELGKLQKEYKQNESAINKNESSLTGLNTKLNKTQVEILQSEKALETFQEELDDSGKKSKDLGKNVEELEEKFDGVNGMAITAAGAIGTAMVGATGVLVKGANDSVRALNDLQAKTGRTSEEIEELSEIAKNVYNDGMGEGFEEVTESIAVISQVLELTGDELESFTKGALLLADTFGTEINETVKTTNSLMRNFGISGDEALNIIAQGFQMGGDVSGELLDSLNEYSVSFSSMGFSAEDFTNILVDGVSSGVFAIDKVGDAVKEFAIRSKDGSESSALAFESLGLSADLMTSKFAQGGETSQEAFNNTMTALNNLEDPIVRNTTGVALFGTQFEDLEAGAIGALAHIGTSVDINKNSLEEMSKVKYSDMESALTVIGRTLKSELSDTITTNVLPKLNDFIGNISTNMPIIQEKVEGAINVIVPLFEGFVSVIGFVIDNSNWLIPVLVGVLGSIVALNVISGVVGLITTWGTVTKGLTAIQGIFNVVLSANPIGLVIIAIGALIAIGVALWMNWDTIVAKCREFTTVLIGKWNELKESTSRIFSSIGDAMMQPVNWAKDKIKGAIESIKGFFNFQWSFPKLKMPHFTWSGSVNPLKWGEVGVPRVGVEWYKNGGIMTEPTMFGMNGNNAMVGGEAGAEAILPLSQLWNQLGNNFDKLEKKLNSNKEQVIYVTNITNLDSKEIAKETVPIVTKKMYSNQKKLGMVRGI